VTRVEEWPFINDGIFQVMYKWFFICCVLASAIGCQTSSKEDKIQATAQQVVQAIQYDNEKAFEALLCDTAWKQENERNIELDFEKCKMLYDQFLKGKSINVIVTNEYNQVGCRKVVIPFSDKKDSTSHVAVVRLELYFGPEHIMPSDKIFRYELVANQDMQSSFGNDRHTLKPLL